MGACSTNFITIIRVTLDSYLANTKMPRESIQEVSTVRLRKLRTPHTAVVLRRTTVALKCTAVVSKHHTVALECTTEIHVKVQIKEQ